MSKADNLFSGLVGKAINESIESTRDNNNPAYIRLVLAISGILLFVGNEAIKVVFRKNFGFKGISIGRVIVCFLCFLTFGIVGIVFSISNDGRELSDLWFGRSSFFVSGVFYILLSFYLLRKAFVQRANAIKNQDFSDYQGESDLLNTLHLHGWSQTRIKYLAEPLYTLLLGATVFCYNPFAAIPFLICSLSVWGFGIMEFMFLQQPFQPDLNQGHHFSEHSTQPTTNRVNTDFN
jgi:hypothetical protein